MNLSLENIIRAVEPLPGTGKMIDVINYVVNWANANSLWPLVYGTSCCAIEMMSAGSSHNDWARFGVEVARATPRQADLIIIAGTLTEKMAPRLKTLYEQIPEPKYVIAMGACAISGGPFYYDSYAVVKGADRVIPVDVFIPGCPPRPESLLYGIMQLQEVIKKRDMRKPTPKPPLETKKAVDVFTVTAESWDAKEAAEKAARDIEIQKFKEQNPDYKPFKRGGMPPKEKLAAVEFKKRPPTGLSPDEMLAVLRARMGEGAISLYNEGGPSSVNGDALEARVAPKDYLTFFETVKNDPELRMDYLTFLTAVDWKDRLEVVVHLQSTAKGHQMIVGCPLEGRANPSPSIDTLTAIYPGANFHERETHDFFGIVFRGHPDLRRILTPENIEGYPLLKDWDDPAKVIKRPY